MGMMELRLVILDYIVHQMTLGRFDMVQFEGFSRAGFQVVDGTNTCGMAR